MHSNNFVYVVSAAHRPCKIRVMELNDAIINGPLAAYFHTPLFYCS
jgi:hypothetical protein